MQKTGIFPNTIASLSSNETQFNSLSDLEQSVSDPLDALAACAIFQWNKDVNLEYLVNTAGEMFEGEESSEKEASIAVIQ